MTAVLWFPYSQPSIAMMPHTTADHYHQHYRLRRHHHHSLHTESWRLFLHIENGGKQTKNKTNSDDMDRWTDIGHIQTDRQMNLFHVLLYIFVTIIANVNVFFFCCFFFCFVSFLSSLTAVCLSVCVCMYVDVVVVLKVSWCFTWGTIHLSPSTLKSTYAWMLHTYLQYVYGRLVNMYTT